MRVLIVLLAMTAGAFLKGVTGSGLPLIAIPVMATFTGVEEAVVVMAIPGAITNTWLMWHHRLFLEETRDLPLLLATGVVGVAVGAWLLENLDDRILSLVLAGMVVAYVANVFLNPRFRLREELTRYASPPVGLAAGVLQGATGISGPILATYLHAYRLHQRAYVLSITTVFQVFALAQIVAMAVLGLYTTRRLGLSVLAVVPAMAVLPLGARLAGKLSRRTFDIIVLTVLVGSAAKLVWDAVAGS